VLALPDPDDAAARAHPRISVLLAQPRQPPTFDALNEWLDNLAGRLGERLLRVKGIVGIADHDRPLVIQSVGTLFAAPRPIRTDDDRSFLVLIARDVDISEIAGLGGGMAISPWSRPDPFARAPARALRADAI
jgi:G3E family GTPase